MAGGVIGILVVVDRICPLLAIGTDRRVAIDGVDASHRCHAVDDPIPLDRSMQSQLCLTASHSRCERYRQYVARTGIAAPARAPVADGLVATRLVLTPEPAWRGIAGRARATRSASVGAVAAGTLAIGLIGVGAVAALQGGGIDLGALLGASPAPTATGGSTPVVSPSERPSPTAMSEPTAEASVTVAPTVTPAPTPSPPSATPAPTPAPQATYTVVAGDTLALIAQRFGTTPAALQAANAIEDPNEIVIGQILVIP